MTTPRTGTEDFFLRLAKELEVLGPEETNDLVAEIRGHLAEAAKETSGDEYGALARFGSPEILAARILEERGVLPGGPGLPEAPAWMRWIARMMDVSIWMAVPLVLALVPLTVYFWGPAAHTPLPGLNPLWLVFLWFLVAAVAAATGWWAIRRRERPRATTTGMSIMGLRRVHIGESLRTVRVSQVPGVSHSPLGRIRPLLSALLALAMVVLFFCALSWSSAHAYKVEHEATIKSAMTNAQSGVYIVQTLYDMAIEETATEEDLRSFFAQGATSGLTELLERRASAQIDSYWISLSAIPDYDSLAGRLTCPITDEITVPVLVTEYSTAPDTCSYYEYNVSWVSTELGESEWEGQWLITSAKQVERVVYSESE